MLSPRSKQKMLEEFRRKKPALMPEYSNQQTVSQEESEVHFEPLEDDADIDHRDLQFERQKNEEKKKIMQNKAFFIFLISAVTVFILAIIWFVIDAPLPIEWKILMTVIIFCAVAFILKLYFIDPLIIDYKQYIEPWL
jgi:hypothetical protein